MYDIILKRKGQSYEISLKSVEKNIKVQTVNKTFHVVSNGKRGLPGPAGEAGAPGEGLPEGGSPGQLLVKAGVDDYDVGWSSASGGDKNYIQQFTATDFITVTHNLAKYPAVSVLDSAGDEVVGEVEYVSINQLVVAFTAPFTGMVTCN